MNLDIYQRGFEERGDLRSAFIRDVILQHGTDKSEHVERWDAKRPAIPKKLIRYWHDPSELPNDVRECLETWDRLADEGFEFRMFDDVSAADYIANVYGDREREAFTRCAHPAMRCDYLRMCFVLEEGGLYVDADDVLLGEAWRRIFYDDKLKLQPLCYDVSAGGMTPAAEIWRPELPVEGRIFYVNNDPIAAPARHPVLRRALARATARLLDKDVALDIQNITGPGNLTAALAAHAHCLLLSGLPFDFELLRDWELMAEVRWNLSYRSDDRNWRNVYGY